MKQIILASTSPRRKALLQQVGLKFRAVGSNYDEKMNPRLKPRSNAEQLSLGKAMAAAERYAGKDAPQGPFIIIAADTFVLINDQILGKPKTEQEARRMLTKLSGTMHEVITGFTIYDTESKKIVTKSEVTKVFFRKLSKKEIEGYVATGEPMDAAGSYKMQEKAALFVERVEGDVFNIIGLPLTSLFEELKRFGVYLY